MGAYCQLSRSDRDRARPRPSRSLTITARTRTCMNEVVLHYQGDEDQQPLHFRSRNSEVTQGAKEVSKSKLPIGIIVLYKHNLIIHVIQGLSLLTANLRFLG